MIIVKSNNPPISIRPGLYTFEDPIFVSDEYHTMEELYDHRRELTRVFFQSIKKDYYVGKSKQHSDGTMFPGYFIVYAKLPTGLISYHYDIKYWDDFDLIEEEQAPEYDGHTSRDVLERLRSL
jgi:hypothetical protein